MSHNELLKPIVLYDIPCATPGLPWSPNTMVTRYCLGYKGLPFTTDWVEFPDIARVLQSKGVTGANTDPNGPGPGAAYTLPAIEDPNTGAVVMDSLQIAAYLDDTYPDTPKVWSGDAKEVYERMGLPLRSSSAAGAGAGSGGGDMEGLMILMVFGSERLTRESQEFYHRTREARFGERWKSFVEAASRVDDRAQMMRRAVDASKAAWQRLEGVYDEKPGEYVLGEEPCAFDFAVAGRVKYVAASLGEVEKKELMEGRWGKLAESLEKYYKY